jgi:hypothetical protein
MGQIPELRHTRTPNKFILNKHGRFKDESLSKRLIGLVALLYQPTISEALNSFFKIMGKDKQIRPVEKPAQVPVQVPVPAHAPATKQINEGGPIPLGVWEPVMTGPQPPPPSGGDAGSSGGGTSTGSESGG